jgi:hypothetical protein
MNPHNRGGRGGAPYEWRGGDVGGRYPSDRGRPGYPGGQNNLLANYQPPGGGSGGGGKSIVIYDMSL